MVTTIVIVPFPGANDGISTSKVSPPSSGDWWPSFLSSSAILRTFLGLLALLAGIFFVVAWRRRRDEEEQTRPYPGRIIPPTDPPTATLA